MEKIYQINNQEYLKKQNEHKIKFNTIFAILSIIAVAVYIIGFNSEENKYLLISFSSILTITLIWFSLKIGLKNSTRTWKSYKIILNDYGIEREYEIPIYRHFQKTIWKKSATKILWNNAEIEEKNRVTISDKTFSKIRKNLTDEGKIIIPNEIENKKELIELIKNKI